MWGSVLSIGAATSVGAMVKSNKRNTQTNLTKLDLLLLVFGALWLYMLLHFVARGSPYRQM